MTHHLYTSCNPGRVLGINLSPAEQELAKRVFVSRCTGDHVPEREHEERLNGTPCPLQFKDDHDWLAHTEFSVTEAGLLDFRYTDCFERPTWPENADLRSTAESFAASCCDTTGKIKYDQRKV